MQFLRAPGSCPFTSLSIGRELIAPGDQRRQSFLGDFVLQPRRKRFFEGGRPRRQLGGDRFERRPDQRIAGDLVVPPIQVAVEPARCPGGRAAAMAVCVACTAPRRIGLTLCRLPFGCAGATTACALLKRVSAAAASV